MTVSRRSNIVVAVGNQVLERLIAEALPSPHFSFRVVAGPDLLVSQDWKLADVEVIVTSGEIAASAAFIDWWRGGTEPDAPAVIIITGTPVPAIFEDHANIFIVEGLPTVDAVQALVSHAAGLSDFTRNLHRTAKELSATVAELDALTERLDGAGTCDPDTALYNRGYFVSRLRDAVAGGCRFSVLFIDIDHLQKYNDTHGRDEGDYLLQQFADVLASRFPPSFTIARYSGDEFAILLPATDKLTAINTAENLRKYLQDFPFLGCETQPFGCITVSAGVAEYPDDGTDAESLLAAAEGAVRQAKKAGRNTVSPAPTVA